MEKLLATLCIVIVALSFLCGFLLLQISDLQSQNSELQNQTSELEAKLSALANATVLVKITEFTVTEGTEGGTMPPPSFLRFDINLTVQNFGANDVEGLSLSVRDAMQEGSTNNRVQVELLISGEAQNVTTQVYLFMLGRTEYIFVATLFLDDIILDERTYEYVW